jgi:gluconokinase
MQKARERDPGAQSPSAVLVMGVTGCGKTTVGKALAAKIGWAFVDADEYHPESNREKMRRGIPLTDEDRAPWLAALAKIADEHLLRGERMVLGCSALKERYRRVLLGADPGRWRIVHLTGDFAVLSERVHARSHEFMNPVLLKSQFEALEPPRGAVEIEVGEAPGAIVDNIVRALNLSCV